MPKAASWSRKPNPVAMFWRRRLTSVLWVTRAMTAATTATNTTWRTMPRTRGSRHGAGRFGRAAMVTVSPATAPAPISADRHRVDQPTLGPQIVVAALELERRAETEMPVENLAVIADRLDRVVGPFLIEPQSLAHARSGTEHALQIGGLALRHLVDVGLGDTLFFGLEQCIDDPIDDVVPLVVTVTHDRRQRFLRNAIGQDDVIV